MKRIVLCAFVLGVLILSSCRKDDFNDTKVEIPDFNYPTSVDFADSLSTYGIFNGTPSDLTPNANFHLLELSSVLFTDYAHKQRLVKIPDGQQIMRMSDGSIAFPDQTILVKTFYYYNDERDPSLGKRIIESRLLIKENGIWNVATYVWNQAQTEAVLQLNGMDTHVSWVSAEGKTESTNYHVPNENECIACHQSNNTMTPLGPTLRNLNRTVVRDGNNQNQILHLQSLGLINNFALSQVPVIVDYTNTSLMLADRARAYLDMNCSHCHNPTGWDKASEKDFDFRYETSLNQTGIVHDKDRVLRTFTDGEMPFVGTSMMDKEGRELLTQFIENL